MLLRMIYLTGAVVNDRILPTKFKGGLLVNKTPVLCYNLLLLGSVIYSVFAFHFNLIDLSFKNILGSYLAISIGILCNMALISRIKREVKL